MEQQGVVFSQEDYIQTSKSLQKKPIQFQQEMYVLKIENKGKDILNTLAKAQSIGFITLSRIPIHTQYITSIQTPLQLLSTIHNINSNRPIPNTEPDPSDDSDNRDDEYTDSEDNQPEERPNYYSTEPLIRYSMNRNSTGYNNRTTQAANKPHSSNTPQTSRFASVRPSDNLARQSYVNQAIQRAEIVN